MKTLPLSEVIATNGWKNGTVGGWNGCEIKVGDKVKVHGLSGVNIVAKVRAMHGHSTEIEIVKSPKRATWQPGNIVSPVSIWWLEVVA